MITVTVFTPTMAVTVSSTTICSGSSATITASGADEFAWNSGFNGPQIVVSPTATTVYSVTATTYTDNSLGCTLQNSIQILVHPKPVITVSSTGTLICKGETTTLTASGADTYSWSSGAEAATTTVAPTAITINSYSVTGTDANGCKSTAAIQVRVSTCNSISEYGIGNAILSVYPNPSKGEFVIQGEKEMTLDLVNELGQKIRVIKVTSANNFQTKVSGLSGGIYFLRGEDQIEQKIIVEK
jgi:hypothetical protein